MGGPGMGGMGGPGRGPMGPPPPRRGWGRGPNRGCCLGCLGTLAMAVGGFAALIVMVVSFIF
ncbi:MAG: hypothetical protein LUF78_12345 [Clostridiales bacterium]|nr:hypothetical protein [Clostridiales bacterium]